MPTKSDMSTHELDLSSLSDQSFKGLITTCAVLSDAELLGLQSILDEERSKLIGSTRTSRCERQFNAETSLLFAKLVGVSVILHTRGALTSPGWNRVEDKVRLKDTLGMALDLATQAERDSTYATDEKRSSTTPKSVRWCNSQLKAAEKARTKSM